MLAVHGFGVSVVNAVNALVNVGCSFVFILIVDDSSSSRDMMMHLTRFTVCPTTHLIVRAYLGSQFCEVQSEWLVLTVWLVFVTQMNDDDGVMLMGMLIGLFVRVTI